LLGFETLTKAEIKKDCKEIEKSNAFMPTREVFPDREEESFDNIQRSFQPACNIESTLFNKYRRLVTWMKHPKQKDEEIAKWQQKVIEMRNSRRKLEKEHDDWLTIYDVYRQLLLDSIHDVNAENQELREQGDILVAACDMEAARSSSSNTLSNKSYSNRELLEELERREEELEVQLEDFLLLAQLEGCTTVIPKVCIPEDIYPFLYPSASDIIPLKEEGRKGYANKVESLDLDEARALATKRMMCYMNSLDDQLRISDNYGDLNNLDPSYFERDGESLIQLISSVNGSNDTVQNVKTENGTAAPFPTKEDIRKAFSFLNTQADIAAYINATLDPSLNNTLGNSSSATLLATRKKRRGPMEAIQLLTNARSRVEHGPRVLFSPLSQFEDRFLATEVVGNFQNSELFLSNLLPQQWVDEEDRYMDDCSMYSELAAKTTKVVQIEQEVQELRKLLQEAQVARNKAEGLYRQALLEDDMEKQRIHQELIYYGVIEGELEKVGDNNGENSTFLITENLPTAALPVTTKKTTAASRRANLASNRSSAQNTSVSTVGTAQSEDGISEPSLSQSRAPVSSPVADRLETQSNASSMNAVATVTSKRKAASQAVAEVVANVAGKRCRR
jgi:hypothetical protein